MKPNGDFTDATAKDWDVFGANNLGGTTTYTGAPRIY